MSVAISFYNSHGIVMSADRRIVSKINRSSGIIESIVLTDTEQKLFQLSNQCGLSITGSFSIGGIPISSLINAYIKKNDIEKIKPSEYILKLAQYIRERQDDSSDNCILILSGYRNTLPYILSCNTLNSNITNHIGDNSKCSVTYSGESEILNILLNSNGFAYDYAKYSLQDAVEFSEFIIKTVAGLQKYQQKIQTVSEECDILCITPYRSLWANQLSVR